jgi:hypothetical protein
VSEPRPSSFFDPPWRRVAVLVFVACWAAYEILVSKDQLWSLATIGMFAYGYWSFFVKWPKPDSGAKSDG